MESKPLGNLRVPVTLLERLDQFVEKDTNRFATRAEAVRAAIWEFLERHDQ